MRLVKGGGSGYSLGGSETAGSSFNEFAFADEQPISCEEVVYPPFPASPGKSAFVMFYHSNTCVQCKVSVIRQLI